MGHLLPAVSLGSESRDRSETPVRPNPAGPNLIPSLSPRTSLRAQDIRDVTGALRHALDAGTQPPASIIHAATEFARILTGAHGVALGVQLKGVFVCRARSGDLAPELGSKLNAGSGISGECLRSGSVVVCDDTVSDDRVDRETCRALGVRSILAVPVRGNTGPVGMLEVFSRELSAFSGDKVEALQALTEIIAAAHSLELQEREMHERDRALDSTRALLAKRISPAMISPRGMRRAISEDKLSRRILDGPPLKRRYWIAAMAVSALMLGFLGVWLSWHDPTPDTAEAEAPTPEVPQKSEAKPAPHHTTFMKPEAGITLPRPDRRHQDGLLRKAAEISSLQDQQGSNSNGVLPPEEVGEGFIASKPSNPEPSSVNIAPPSDGVTLPTVAATSAPLPALENRNTPVSQGVTEARLIHEVQPAYPAQARALRQSGAVTLNATIAEDGSVRGVGVVSGPPILAAAAIDAVKKWRYTPSLLDGKPVAVEKQITVVFKLP